MQVDITGPPKAIVAARHALEARVQEWKTTNASQNGGVEVPEVSLKVAVPQPLIGHIIGKGGSFVREVLKETHVQVRASRNLSTDPDKMDPKPAIARVKYWEQC